MFDRGPILLMLAFALTALVQQYECQVPVDDDVKARLEDKVIQSMSLKELEAMVENDERILTAPRSKIILLPKNRNDPNEEAYIIQRKPKFSARKEIEAREQYQLDNVDDKFRSSFEDEFKSSLFKRSYLPKFRYESAFKFDEEFPSLFSVSDLDSQGSNQAKKLYESLVQEVMDQRPAPERRFSMLDVASSAEAPSYRPRFDYDSYSKDPTEVKLKGKKYWRDEPERREEKLDDKGCRTVVKKIVDPEDAKKYGSNAKSVIITKECESPNIHGPDANIPEMQPIAQLGARLDSRPFASFEAAKSNYQNTRPVELDLPSAKARDPLAPDYIDKMLDSHFKSFGRFNNPLSSFRGYQDRFKLQAPDAIKNVKPTIQIESYDRNHPESGFSPDSAPKFEPAQYSNDPPRPNRHSYRYEYPQQNPANHEPAYDDQPKTYEHHHHYDHPEKSENDDRSRGYESKKAFPSEDKYADKKEPKMMKKSYAYYRKDNPKEDPNDQQYAEEYSHGNYRSFSSDYDSDRDGVKKD